MTIPSTPDPEPAQNSQQSLENGGDEKGCLASAWGMITGAIGCGCAIILILIGIIALVLGLLSG